MPQPAVRPCRLLRGIPRAVMHPSQHEIVGQAHRRPHWQPTHSPYRFFFVQASMRSSAFSMFSIEFATLKRR